MLLDKAQRQPATDDGPKQREPVITKIDQKKALTVPELKAELEKRGLGRGTRGVPKAELVERLQAALEEGETTE
jgi:hypothetical protein